MPLTFAAAGGFQFGSDEFDNPSSDAPIYTEADYDDSTTWNTATTSVTPTLIDLSVTHTGSEGLTGSNYLRETTISVDIASGQTVGDLDIFGDLPDDIVVTRLINVVGPAGTTFTTNLGDDAATGSIDEGLNVFGERANESTAVYDAALASAHGGVDLTAPATGGSLVVNADSVTGTASKQDIQVTFEYYVAEFDAEGNRVIPARGEDDLVHSQSTLNARAIGDWVASDVRDGGATADNAVADPAGDEHVLDAKSIATQKSVTIVGTDGVATGRAGDQARPGDILRYTINFQINDYFTYGDIYFDDLMGDGQRFVDENDFADLAPTFTVGDDVTSITGGGFDVYRVTTGRTEAGAYGATFIVDETDISTADNAGETGAPGDGTEGNTAITIRLSDAMIAAGDADGILQGALTFDSADDDADAATNPSPTAGDNERAAATGTIVFYAQVRDEYSDIFPSGDRSIDQNDSVSNAVTVRATTRENLEDNADATQFQRIGPNPGNLFTPDPDPGAGGAAADQQSYLISLYDNGSSFETDGGSASVSVEAGTLTKSLHAINGDTNLPSAILVTPEDRVSYRLTYTLPTSDFEQLRITDFLPLPVFDVNDPNADNTTGDTWTFDHDSTTNSYAAGTVEVLASDTFHELWDTHDDNVAGNESAAPMLVVDIAGNSLTLDFGSFDLTQENGVFQSTVIDVILTVVVQDDPFADGLLLTNVAEASEQTTAQTAISQVDLVQIELGTPELTILKGIVATSRDGDIGDQQAAYTTATQVNELQALTVTGDFALTLGGGTTPTLPAAATADDVLDALLQLGGVERGDVTVSGGGGNPLLIALTGNFAGTDVDPISVTGAATIATVIDGGSAAAVDAPAAARAILGGPGTTIDLNNVDAATLAANPIDHDVEGLDAGDTVRYVVTVANNGGGEAYDLQIVDVLPEDMRVADSGLRLRIFDGSGHELNWTAINGGDTNPLFEDGITIDDPSGDFAAAEAGAVQRSGTARGALYIVYDLQVEDTIGPQTTRSSDASMARFASREGGTNFTTAGAGRDAAELTSRSLLADKTITSTSEPTTTRESGIETVTPGEVVRYRLVTQIAEGTLEDFVIRENLRGGLQFLNDDTARVLFVSNNDAITSSAINDASAFGSDETAAPTFALADPLVSNSDSSNVDVYVSGTDVFFSLGDVVNRDSDSGDEFVIIEFNAIVGAGGVATDAGDLIQNSFAAQAGGVLLATSTTGNANTVKVVEPKVTVTDRTIGATIADNGDTVEVSAEFEVAIGADQTDAFNVVFQDNFADDAVASGVVLSIVSDPSGTFDVADATITITSTGVRVDIPHAPEGLKLKLDYDLTFGSTVQSGDAYEIDNSVTWTSLPGADGTTSNSTGSDTPGAAGTATGERTGADGPTGSPTQNDGANDYAAERTDSLAILNPTITRELTDTEIDSTGNDDTEAAIGELVTFTVTVDLPEATTRDLVISETLDPGFAYVDMVTNDTTGGDPQLGHGAGWSTPSVSADGRTITWDVGDVTNSAANDGDNEQLTFTFRAVVNDVASNQGGPGETATTLGGGATASWTEVNAAGNDVTDSASDDTGTVDVVEPKLTVVTDAFLDNNPADTTGDGGDDITLRYTITNGSGVDAFDLGFTAAVPEIGGGRSAVTFADAAAAITVTDSAGLLAASDFELVGDNATGWTVRLKPGREADFAAGSRSVVIELDGTLDEAIPAGGEYATDADLTWTSLDGDRATASRSTQNSDGVERTGADGENGAVDDYATSDEAAVTRRFDRSGQSVARWQPSKRQRRDRRGVGQREPQRRHDRRNVDLPVDLYDQRRFLRRPEFGRFCSKPRQ